MADKKWFENYDKAPESFYNNAEYLFRDEIRKGDDQMTDTKHTPTPWMAVSNDSYWTIVPENRCEDDPYQIGDVCSSYPDDKNQGLQQANAAHIVKCVNMHDELVEALRVLNDLNENHSPFGGEMYQDRINRAWHAARETLKKAGAL